MPELRLGTSLETSEPVNLDASLLSKHVAILGSIGSGKTVAAKVLLEEATLAGIPSIVIDPQGDISKMAFKEPQSVLVKNGVDLERSEMLDSKAEYRIWTPASELGLPLSINPFGSAPSLDDNFDRNASLSIAAIDLMAAGFAAICGYSEKNKSAQIKGFLNEILMHAVDKKNMPESFNQLSAMVSNIQAHLEIMGLEADEVTDTVQLITDSDRKELSRRLRSLNTGVNRLLFQSGVALDPQTLVTPIEKGYTPVNLILINSLPDEDTKQKFVAELSRSLYAWGTSSPEALKIVYFVDEAHQFIPPTSAPASKAPLMNLFRRGRHCGIACIVASQQLTDLDYKALGNVNTKLIGRVTDPRERDKLREMFANATNPKESLDSLSNAQPGEFILLCPELSRTPIPIKIRWLYRKHGRPITEAEIKKIVNSKQRKWAKNVQDGLEHRLSGLRTNQPLEIPETSEFIENANQEEMIEQEANEIDGSSIESQDSVFSGDINQKTIHGAEKVEFHFNLGDSSPEEKEKFVSNIKTGYALESVHATDSAKLLRQKVSDALNSRSFKVKIDEPSEVEEIINNNDSSLGERKSNRTIYTVYGDLSRKMDRIIEKVFHAAFWFLFAVVIFAAWVEILYSMFPKKFPEFVVQIFELDRTTMDWDSSELKYLDDSFILFVLAFLVFSIALARRYYLMQRMKETVDSRKEYFANLITEENNKIEQTIRNFEISSGYSNFYCQTNESEYEIVGILSSEQENHVICRRRAHRKFADNGKEAKEWISTLVWDQIVTLEISEFCKILLGNDPGFTAREWAKREVMI